MAAITQSIIISSQPKGTFLEGIVSGTPKPGTCMEIVSTARVNGRFTWQAQSTDGSRKAVVVLLEDRLQGKLITDAYVTGTRCFLYAPAAGEEIHVLKEDISGTGSALEDLSVGEYLKINANGKVTAADVPPVPEIKPFQAMDALVDQSGDELIPVFVTGV